VGLATEATNPSWPNISIDIQCVKLELGNVSTLLNDPGVDFGKELAICQRYLTIISNVTNPDTPRQIRASAMNPNGNGIFFDVPVPAQLRINPAIEYVRGGSMQVRNYATGDAESGFTFAVNSISPGTVRIAANKAAHGLTDAVLDIHNTLLHANV
jgi:hypothetical protein